MVTIYIDNQPVEVEAGTHLLEAILSKGYDVPYFCWHPALGSVGACRQCAVIQYKDANDTKGRLVMSCMTPVAEGNYFSLQHPDAEQFRKQIAESLMTNHPHDCPVCDEGGECHLQDMTLMTGQNYRTYRFKKRTFNNQNLGPLINHEMNRCIACYRCVRYYKDVAGGKDLDVYASSNHVYFGREKDGVLESEFSGNLVEVCPTGVFTDKAFKKHFNRVWDLQTAPSVCQLCSVGCNTLPAERYGSFRRIRNRYNADVNGYFICDKGRFGHAYASSDKRLKAASRRKETAWEELDSEKLVESLRNQLHQAKKIIGIGSGRASLESNFALRTLVGPENFYANVREEELSLQKEVAQLIQKGAVPVASIEAIGQADAILVLGEDITNTAARMALAVREAVNHQKAERAQALNVPRWNDAAIRNWAREPYGNVHLASLTASKLDDIAQTKLTGTPEEIAHLGYSTAHGIDSQSPEAIEVDDSIREMAQNIATALEKAKRPVVITGTSLLSKAILEASLNIVYALRGKGVEAKWACAFSEANSLGLAMLQPRSLDAALESIQQASQDMTFVVEADCVRSLSGEQRQQLKESCGQLIVLESLKTPTSEMADVLLPATTFFEGAGTFVNYEGRAQRYYGVVPKPAGLKDSWRWLGALLPSHARKLYDWENLDKITQTLALDFSLFKPVADKMLTADYRINGQRIPRQPLSASGRTAIYANVTMHEPQTPVDPDSPLSHSMEGYSHPPPSQFTPFFWAPHWNSVQSVNKFQEKVGGPLRGGEEGIQLGAPYTPQLPSFFYAVRSLKLSKKMEDFWVLPLYHLFGSEERASYVNEIQELTPSTYALITESDAKALQLSSGDIVQVNVEGKQLQLKAQLSQDLPQGYIGLPFLPDALSFFRANMVCQVASKGVS